LLRHALCFAEVSNALAYPLSLFFFGHVTWGLLLDTLADSSSASYTC
jgi:hypothetical protein